MLDFVCKQNTDCVKKCKKVYIEPDYDKLSESSYTVEFCGFAIEVATEDIVGVDGKKFWSFPDALEISRQIQAKSGWRLPTPAEAEMIMGYTAWCDGEKTVTAEVLENELKLERNGFGYASDDCIAGPKYAQEVGETGIYWTDSLKDWPADVSEVSPSAMVMKIKYGIGFMTSAIIGDIAASVRLVRDV